MVLINQESRFFFSHLAILDDGNLFHTK